MYTKSFIDICKKIRQRVIRSLYFAEGGHAGSSLSIVEILSYLYFDRKILAPKKYEKFVLSKGHAAPALYAVLNLIGKINNKELNTLRKIGSKLQGHPDRKLIKDIHAGTGALGQGLSMAIGFAIAEKIKKTNKKSFCILGDGEMQEGQIWEAAMAAVHHEVNNLNVFVDRNRIQNDDFMDKQLRLFDVAAKWEGFGWAVRECDGHNMSELLSALEWMDSITDRPAVLIAHTIKGKGVSFMEDNPAFHGAAPNDEQLAQAMEELQ